MHHFYAFSVRFSPIISYFISFYLKQNTYHSQIIHKFVTFLFKNCFSLIFRKFICKKRLENREEYFIMIYMNIVLSIIFVYFNFVTDISCNKHKLQSSTANENLHLKEVLLLSHSNDDNQSISIDRMDNETSFPLDIPLHVILFGTMSYGLVFLIGVCGNLLVLVVLFKNRELRTTTNYFLANLSGADLMTLFVCVPSALHDLYAKERWYLGRTMCKIIPFIENCTSIASIFTILLISIERFFAICQPFYVIFSIIKNFRKLLLIFSKLKIFISGTNYNYKITYIKIYYCNMDSFNNH